MLRCTNTSVWKVIWSCNCGTSWPCMHGSQKILAQNSGASMCTHKSLSVGGQHLTGRSPPVNIRFCTPITCSRWHLEAIWGTIISPSQVNTLWQKPMCWTPLGADSSWPTEINLKECWVVTVIIWIMWEIWVNGTQHLCTGHFWHDVRSTGTLCRLDLFDPESQSDHATGLAGGITQIWCDQVSCAWMAHVGHQAACSENYSDPKTQENGGCAVHLLDDSDRWSDCGNQSNSRVQTLFCAEWNWLELRMDGS